MKTLYIKIAAILILLTSISCQTKVEESQNPNKTLVWSDEFNYEGDPDPEKWGYDIGDGCPTLCGWGNNELQYYTRQSKNVRVENNNLIIEVHSDRSDSLRKYSSARILTKNKGDWKYGIIEVKAKLPRGKGTWPAIWMLPTNWRYGGWPQSGEIDIMEHVGFDHGNIHGTVHTESFNHRKGTQKGDSIVLTTVSEEFHVYSIKWSPEKIEFMVNDEIYNIFTNNGEGTEAWPFDQPFHVILNIAVGGDWGGKYGVDDTIWPQRMEVDYVRVYKLDEEETLTNN